MIFNTLKKYKKLKVLFIITFILLLIISFIYNYFSTKFREKNLYNIGNYVDKEYIIKADSIAIFDEFVYDNFNNINLNLDNSRLHRAKSKIDGTNSVDATQKSKEIYNALNNLKDNDVLFDKQDFQKINNIIYDEKFEKLNFNHLTKLNNENYNKKIMYNSYIKNKNIYLDESGYVLNFIDGYENLINYENINFKFLSDIIDSKNIIKKINGVKYVNNKEFNLIVKVKKSFDINNFNFNNIKISIKNKKLDINNYEIFSQEDYYVIKFKMIDGFDEFINNRFSKIDLNLGVKKGFYVPKKSIIEFKNLKGIYFVSNGKVVFSPISIIEEENDMYFINTNFKTIFPNIVDYSGLEFKELTEFSNIILNPEKYEIGDLY